MIGVFYQHKKELEFINDYWPKFKRGLQNINHKLEFNQSQVINDYISLSVLEQIVVQRECMEIYAFNDVLTYADFIDVVNKYVSKESSKPIFSGFDGAA